MSILHKSKTLTFYIFLMILPDVLMIYLSSVTLHLESISLIYLARTAIEQSNFMWQNSFLDININVDGNDMHTSV